MCCPGLTDRSKPAREDLSTRRIAGAAEVREMSEPDRDWETPFGTPQGVANPGGILQPDTQQSTGDDRLDQLPDFENDELRGASEQGAGVLSKGGTAQETGQASGTDRPS